MRRQTRSCFKLYAFASREATENSERHRAWSETRKRLCEGELSRGWRSRFLRWARKKGGGQFFPSPEVPIRAFGGAPPLGGALLLAGWAPKKRRISGPCRSFPPRLVLDRWLPSFWSRTCSHSTCRATARCFSSARPEKNAPGSNRARSRSANSRCAKQLWRAAVCTNFRRIGRRTYNCRSKKELPASLLVAPIVQHPRQHLVHPLLELLSAETLHVAMH